ncbi:MAG: hydroxymethylglutaryl-CoA lyase [Alphaproteobacteria bacterium]|nr:hydroxymethylglutaryl-CoA lyase [Alphaproteobacteria bacterium]
MPAQGESGNGRVTINEVGLRDGLQNHPRRLGVAEKLELYRALRISGLHSFELTSFVSPKAVPAMADAAELVAALPPEEGVNLTALVPNRRGYARAREAGMRGIAVVLAATETLNQRNIGMSLDRAREECAAVLRQAAADGVFARAYVAAACACPYEGPTSPDTVIALAEEMLAAGADEVAIADTIGAGNPRQVATLFRSAVARCGAGCLSAHFHDTRALGVTLSWVALQEGIRKFDASIGGLGGCPFAPGASGNLATEDLVFMLEESGYRTQVDLPALMAAASLAGRLLGGQVGGRITPWYESRHRSRNIESNGTNQGQARGGD